MHSFPRKHTLLLGRLLLATQLAAAPWVSAQINSNSAPNPDGLSLRQESGKSVLGVDGVGVVEVADTPAGPWLPMREAMPEVKFEAELPLAAARRFIRIRRPDGRVEEVVSAAKHLPPAPPAFINPKASGFDGQTVLVEAQLPAGQPTAAQLPYFIGEQLIIFRDDGTNGDKVAGDGSFMGRVPLNLTEVQRTEIFLNGLPPGEPVMKGIRNRAFQPQENVTPAQALKLLEDLKMGKEVPLPLPLGVSASALRSVNQQQGRGVGVPAITPCGLLPTWQKTLLVKDLTVVNDPVRTFDPCTGMGTPMGAWTFGKLMTDMANQTATGISPSDFAMRWLRTWTADQMINNDPVPKRPDVVSQIIQKWPKDSLGNLDMAKAPFRLLAIVNRLDLRGNVAYGGGVKDPCDPSCESGEGRFVFCFCDRQLDNSPGGYNGGGTTTGGTAAGGRGKEFIVIMEYCIPHADCRMLHAYAQQWANLECLPWGPGYNAALENITKQFTSMNAMPNRPNGSALNQLRTNENLLDPNGLWELREFALFRNDSDANHLRPVTVKQTPRQDVDGTPFLQSYITGTAPAPPNHSVPLGWPLLPGGPKAPLLGGRAIMQPVSFVSGSPDWATSGASVNNMLRHDFALQTCNGCHSTETGARFTHVGCRLPGLEAPLSNFLIGDGVGGNHVHAIPGAPAANVAFFDLQRREQDLVNFIITPCGLSLVNATGLAVGTSH